MHDTAHASLDRLRALLDELYFLVKAARPGFWSTSAWFYLLPLGQQQVFGTPEFWLGLIYITFPLGILIYGGNDVVDYETDRLNPRKDSFLFGARPTMAQIKKLPLRIAAVQLPFVALFTVLLGPKALVWFATLVLATLVYNWPRIGFKARPGLDIAAQLGYLLVFVLSSWLNRVPQLPWFTFVFGALFAMHSHLFGEIMDMEPDRQAKRRTTAVAIGMLPSKMLMIFFLVCESVLVWTCAHDPYIAGALALGATWFLMDASLVWQNRPYSPWQMRLFFLGWNAAAVVTMPWVWWTATLGPSR